MYYWLKDFDGSQIYVIDDRSNKVYEVYEGKATLLKMNKFQLLRFNPYLELVDTTAEFIYLKDKD